MYVSLVRKSKYVYVSLVRKSKFGLRVCLLENEVLALFVKLFSDFSSNLKKYFPLPSTNVRGRGIIFQLE